MQVVTTEGCVSVPITQALLVCAIYHVDIYCRPPRLGRDMRPTPSWADGAVSKVRDSILDLGSVNRILVRATDGGLLPIRRHAPQSWLLPRLARVLT